MNSRKIAIEVGVLVLVSIVIALLGAAFLFSLDWVLKTRKSFPVILYFLPIAGFLISYAYFRWGKTVEGGNNQIINEINSPNTKINWLMTPFIFVSTVLSHLFGASVGREGTAVQIGASVADQFSKFYDDRATLLRCGVAAGFASVFGTPLAGLIFAFEFNKKLKFSFQSSIYVAICAFLSDFVTRLLGAPHSHYLVKIFPEINLVNILYSIVCGAIFGLCAMAFCVLSQSVSKLSQKIKFPPLRSLIGGTIFLMIILFLGIENAEKYLGLGIDYIQFSFTKTVEYQDFALKLLLTALLIGTGYKGGEVTPLFFVGATLGNLLSLFVPMDVSFMAAMGFVAVFAGAAKVPLACAAMALKLFGYQGIVLIFVACITAYFCSGKRFTIYKSQLEEK
jgi:H+/Cl- antiporter ClcA